MRRRPLTLVAVTGYLAALVAIALWPTPVDGSIDVMGSWPVRTLVALTPLSPAQGYDLVELGANVALFVPLGWFAMVLLRHATWWRVTVGGVAVSASVELLQAALRPERVAAWTDVAANGLGASVGAALGLLVLRGRPIRRT